MKVGDMDSIIVESEDAIANLCVLNLSTVVPSEYITKFIT